MNANCKISFENFETEIQVNYQTIFQIVVNEWFRRGGDAVFLDNHEINEKSVVVEVGGYTGVWSEKLNNKYKPDFYILEPVEKFRTELVKKFKSNNNIKILDYGLGKPGTFEVSLDTDATSIFDNTGKEKETITIKSFSDFLNENSINTIDLMQINIEGAEYDLLDELINSGLINKIKKIQVQFHLNVENAVLKRQRIRAQLASTHREILNYPFVWEVWEIEK